MQPAYQTLQPGDPWTFMDPATRNRTEDNSLSVGDRISRWFDTSEPGRLFEITALHANSVETRYLGFQGHPGWFLTAEEIAAEGGVAALLARQDAAPL